MTRRKNPEGYINFRSWIVSKLRRASYAWPPRSEAMKRARVARGVYECAQCHEHFGNKEIKVDHIHPVVPFEGFTTWDDYISRMFCDADGFQIVCTNCHDSKTAVEKEMRKSLRAKKKEEE